MEVKKNACSFVTGCEREIHFLSIHQVCDRPGWLGEMPKQLQYKVHYYEIGPPSGGLPLGPPMTWREILFGITGRE